ncbi:MAG: nonstructural protein [Arizlama microvirus]|nr:MAG: nonstructural protein [Arizlama microvirus]
MLLKVFSIRDQKAEVYNTPFFQKSIGEAERNFETLVNDGKSTVNQYPQDFDLFYLGDYDDNLGVMRSLEAPQHVIQAIALKRKETNV